MNLGWNRQPRPVCRVHVFEKERTSLEEDERRATISPHTHVVAGSVWGQPFLFTHSMIGILPARSLKWILIIHAILVPPTQSPLLEAGA